MSPFPLARIHVKMGKNLSDSPLRSVEKLKNEHSLIQCKGRISIKTEEKGKRVALKKHIKVTNKLQKNM